MKKILIFICFYFISFAAFSQDDDIKTVFENKGERSKGAYLSFDYRLMQLENNGAFINGITIGSIIDHKVVIGFSGRAFEQQPTFDSKLKENYAFKGGYGGLYIQPIIGTKYPVHLTVPILLGGGGMAYMQKNNINEDSNFEDIEGFFIANSGLEVEINLVKFLRITLGAYYQYTSSIDMLYYIDNKPIVEPNFFNGLSYGVSIKFGKF